jgi:hypothetical protein
MTRAILSAMAYRPQSVDTHPDVDRLQFEAFARMSPSEKCARVLSLIATARRLAAQGIRERHPGASEREVFLRLVSTWLDRDTVVRAYGFDPETERT